MSARVLFEIYGDQSPLSFLCPQPVSVEGVSKHFPLPGAWHFRAKVPVTSSSPFEDYVWLDLTSGGKIPTYNGTVHLRAYPIDVPPVDYEESDDLIIVKSIWPSENDGSLTGHENLRPRRGSAETGVLKEAVSGFSSMFGKAKAAMETVRKNVG